MAKALLHTFLVGILTASSCSVHPNLTLTHHPVSCRLKLLIDDLVSSPIEPTKVPLRPFFLLRECSALPRESLPTRIPPLQPLQKPSSLILHDQRQNTYHVVRSSGLTFSPPLVSPVQIGTHSPRQKLFVSIVQHHTSYCDQ